MPILGHEQPVLFSMDEVFNPTTANMLLQAQQNYGNILRQDYKESVQDFKDFNKEFGNFYSAIEADNQRYYDQTLGGLGNLYDAMLKQGVDPLRSMEGRAMLQKYIATRPYGELANIRRSADAAKEYIKNRDALIAQGLYNPKFDEFIYGENDPTLWNTSERGIWSRTSPEQYKDLNTSTKHWFDNMELSYDEAASKATGGVYDVYTKSEGTMRQILDTRLKDYLSTNIGKFHLAEYGGDAEALKNAIVDANREVIQQKRSMNEEYAMNRKFAHDIEMENLQHKHALARQRQAKQDEQQTRQINLFESTYLNKIATKGATTYLPHEIIKNGIIPQQSGWKITNITTKGTSVSKLDWKGKGKPTVYKWELVPQKDGTTKMMFVPYELPKTEKTLKDKTGKVTKYKSVSAENAGVLDYVGGTYNEGYYNKIFIDNNPYWIKVNDGSKIKPGKTGIPYSTINQ